MRRGADRRRRTVSVIILRECPRHETIEPDAVSSSTRTPEPNAGTKLYFYRDFEAGADVQVH